MVELQPEIRTVIPRSFWRCSWRGLGLAIESRGRFLGQKARLAHAFVVILRPPFLFTAVNLAPRYALVALIVVKLRKILNLSCRNPRSFGLRYNGIYCLGGPCVGSDKDYRLFLPGMLAECRWVSAAIISVGSSLVV